MDVWKNKKGKNQQQEKKKMEFNNEDSPLYEALKCNNQMQEPKTAKTLK